MESHSTSRQNNGFTLIEILISLGILSLIVALGLFISFDFYRNYSFRSERNTIVSILQKARSQSMDNINQVRHGVYFADPLEYIVFECDFNTPQCVSHDHADTSKDLVIKPAYGSTVSGIPMNVVFDQLSGNCVTCSGTQTVTVNDQGQAKNITISNEGRIDWQ